MNHIIYINYSIQRLSHVNWSIRFIQLVKAKGSTLMKQRRNTNNS